MRLKRVQHMDEIMQLFIHMNCVDDDGWINFPKDLYQLQTYKMSQYYQNTQNLFIIATIRKVLYK